MPFAISREVSLEIVEFFIFNDALFELISPPDKIELSIVSFLFSDPSMALTDEEVEGRVKEVLVTVALSPSILIIDFSSVMESEAEKATLEILKSLPVTLIAGLVVPSATLKTVVIFPLPSVEPNIFIPSSVRERV